MVAYVVCADSVPATLNPAGLDAVRHRDTSRQWQGEASTWAGGVRVNDKSVTLMPEWRTYTFLWDLPPAARTANVVLFSWCDSAASFEVKDFKIVNE